ncbi:ABC transporter ATP-binding protein, partial [Streptomyces sp. NPDC001675]
MFRPAGTRPPGATGLAPTATPSRRSTPPRCAPQGSGRLVRIISADGIEVQALQGLDLLLREAELM